MWELQCCSAIQVGYDRPQMGFPGHLTVWGPLQDLQGNLHLHCWKYKNTQYSHFNKYLLHGWIIKINYFIIILNNHNLNNHNLQKNVVKRYTILNLLHHLRILVSMYNIFCIIIILLCQNLGYFGSYYSLQVVFVK